MPGLLRRKSRNALPSHPPPPPASPPLQPLPLPQTNDFQVQYAPLRSSSDVSRRGPDGAASPPRPHGRAHHLPTPFAYSPDAASLASGNGSGSREWSSLPHSASEPIALASVTRTGGYGAGASPSSLSPPLGSTSPPPSFAHTPSPPGPASVNYAVARRSIASLYPSPSLHPPSSPPPNQPLPPPPPHPSHAYAPASLPRSASHPATLSTPATALPSPASSRPPTAFSQQTHSHRRTRRPPPSYTILLAGARGTGKSSFARTLVEVLASEGGRVVERDVLERGGQGQAEVGVRRTTVEVVEEGGKVALHVLDTAGLEIPLFSPSSSYPSAASAPAAENPLPFETDLHLSALLSFLDARLSAALVQETTLNRAGPGAVGGAAGGNGGGQDPLVHLCLYFVHPGAMSRSQGKGGEGWSLGAADKECVRRLGEKVNVVPILALADTLTVRSLSLAKRGLLASLSSLSLSSRRSTASQSPAPASPASSTFPPAKGDLTALFFPPSLFPSSAPSSAEPASPTTPSPPLPAPPAFDAAAVPNDPHVHVVHLKRNKSQNRLATPLASQPRGGVRAERARSQSRSRARTRGRVGDGREQGEEGDPEEDGEDGETERWTEDELRRRWPFAVVGPDWEGLDDGAGDGGEGGKGRLVREYLHGTVDVLNPAHSDFLPLRHALFGERMEHFKSRTRLGYYEPFRMARLLELQAQQQQRRPTSLALPSSGRGKLWAGMPAPPSPAAGAR
ncbi:hypothetical protein JCM6882_007947 [Rhodosporidiobolus microsporus]